MRGNNRIGLLVGVDAASSMMMISRESHSTGKMVTTCY